MGPCARSEESMGAFRVVGVVPFTAEKLVVLREPLVTIFASPPEWVVESEHWGTFGIGPTSNDRQEVCASIRPYGSRTDRSSCSQFLEHLRRRRLLESGKPLKAANSVERRSEYVGGVA